MTATHTSTLVIGNGMAAGRLVQDLAARGIGDVTVVGDEPYHAYNRLLLSGVLARTQDPRDLEMRTPGWYGRNGVTVLRGIRAVALDHRRREVGLADGRTLGYDRLVLATGSRPNLPSLRGIVSARGGLLPGVFAFRTLTDCEDISAVAAPGVRAVVIGGGLLGLEAARGLSLLGCQVEVVHQAPRLMERQLDAGGAQVLRRTLHDLGITTYLDARAVAVRSGPDGRVAAVRLADHFELACDLVVFACGIRPATALAQAGGLQVGQGIVVDDELATSADGVWAIGECAEHRGVISGWAQSALDHAAFLAARLAGEPAIAPAPARQVTRLRAAGVDLAAMGETDALPDGQTEVLCFADPVRRTYRKTVVRDGRLVGALLVGDVSAAGELSRAFDRGTPVPPDRRDLLFSGAHPPVVEGKVA
jgi:assimilatory nitrate reductase electron transfer subunit